MKMVNCVLVCSHANSVLFFPVKSFEVPGYAVVIQ